MSDEGRETPTFTAEQIHNRETSADAPPPARLECEVVVNGQPITVAVPATSTVRDLIEPALSATDTIGRPESEWEVRLTEGQPIHLDQPLAPFAGQRLWINLRAGYAAADASPPTETWTAEELRDIKARAQARMARFGIEPADAPPTEADRSERISKYVALIKNCANRRGSCVQCDDSIARIEELLAGPEAAADAPPPADTPDGEPDLRYDAAATLWLEHHSIISRKMSRELSRAIGRLVDEATKPLHARLESTPRWRSAR
jgi:hypothetical protein